MDGIGSDSPDERDPGEREASAGALPLAAQLSAAVSAFETSDTLSAPLRIPIESLLRVAAQAVNAAGASVLVRDHDHGGLRFLAVIGDVSEKLIKLRIPPGKGIAGLVLMSGQPMALADVSHEGSFWSEADEKTGFKTITLMATPLRSGEEVVGVLQFVNRPGVPPYAPFTPDEMDTAAHFAESIAKLAQAYEVATLVESMFEQWVKDAASSEEAGARNAGLRAWLKETPISSDHREMVLLGLILFEIANRGDAQRGMCREVLEALARFTEKEVASRTSYLGF